MTTTDTSNIYANAGLTSASQLQTTKETGNSNIGQAGFLQLMTAQLKYQDPFKPMDNTQMVAQMAQFSQLQGQTQGNQYLKQMADAMSGTRLSDAANWIGKSMLVKSDVATPDRNGGYAGQLSVTGDSNDVMVDLVDQSGATVKTIDLGAQTAGDVPFYWNGKDDQGNQAAGGPLQVRVRGGTTSQIATWASVAAVQSPASGTNAQLITPLGNFSPSDALKLG